MGLSILQRRSSAARAGSSVSPRQLFCTPAASRPFPAPGVHRNSSLRGERLRTLQQASSYSAKLPGANSTPNGSSTSSGQQSGKGSSPSTSTTELPQPRPDQPGPSRAQQAAARPLGLKEYHYATFFIILLAGVGFLAVLLYLQAGIEIQQAVGKVLKRLLKTVALRQVCADRQLPTSRLHAWNGPDMHRIGRSWAFLQR